VTGTSFIPALIVILVVRKTQQITDAYKTSGATDHETARTPGELGLRRGLLFKRLVRRNVLIEIAPGRYYLDETSLEIYFARRKTRMMAVVIVLIALIAADMVFGRYWF
jgi:hypothetical protein